MIDFPLTKTNRMRLADAFQRNPRVDLGIDCALEGQMGTALVDDLQVPTVFMIHQPPFVYIAGDVHSKSGQAFLQEIPPYSLIMSLSPGWLDALKQQYRRRLVYFPRYQCDERMLDISRLRALWDTSTSKHLIHTIDMDTAGYLFNQEDHFLDLSMYDSPGDFLERGIGYVAKVEGEIVAGAYASLVCSRGIEVSIYVDEAYRRQGLATALACELLQESMHRGLAPHWDAANWESVHLAKKLGYRFVGAYQAHYIQLDTDL